MITLYNITKEYRVGSQRIPALRDINITFKEKQFVCVYGPSGCGKTTLLNIIGGLDHSTEGSLVIKDTDTRRFKDGDWDAYRNKTVGFVFQNYYLLPHLSVYENVEMPLNLIGINKTEKRKKVSLALKIVGLSAYSKNLPNQLSGGQMQRVAIARAIVNNPDIILADEPTGALDSTTAKKIMELLKDISKERLVIVVSHNTRLADRYADRTIELLDGLIINDTESVCGTSGKPYKKAKTAMPIFTSIRVSFKNLFRTKLRTLLTVFAGCIGIVGVGLVLAIANGVEKYIVDVQKTALANYPIYIRSEAERKEREEDNGQQAWERFPEEEILRIRKAHRHNDYYNALDNNFLDYIGNLDPSLYTVINYNYRTKMHVLGRNDNNYQIITGSIFSEIAPNDFILDQYDIFGCLPEKHNEIALVVDEYNALDAIMIYYLGLDYETRDSYGFEEIIGKQYKVILNNDYYEKADGKYKAKNSYQYPDLYERSELTLEITAILRVKPGAKIKIYQTGLLYTPKLTTILLDDARASDIVTEQTEYGIDKNVFTGLPYEVQETMQDFYEPEYQLKQNLIAMGAEPETTMLSVYTSSFDGRLQIASYVGSYDNKNEEIRIVYSDYIESVTTEFSSMVKVFSLVLIIFSLVSLVVSAILIGIITYVSVTERVKEIGLLRSIGARKIDIARLFIVETAIIGLFSGVIGVVGARMFVRPVNNFVVRMIERYAYTFASSKFIVAQFEYIHVIVLVFGSVLLTMAAGLIPSVIASRKLPIRSLRAEG